MSEKWLEFRVTEPCIHAQDIYEDCPLCTIETLQARIAELEADKLYMKKIQDELVEQRDSLDAALAQALAVANMELEAGLHEEYCPHGANWGACETCPARAGE
jgi:hypothetical protein